jgi:hypothetical protein
LSAEPFALPAPAHPADGHAAPACARCRFAFPLLPSREFQCRRNPPMPIFMGFRQNALGKPEPIVSSFFPQVRGEISCGAFEPAAANASVVPWPAAEASESVPQ